MAYTQERLSGAYEAFRRSPGYQQRQQRHLRQLDEQNRKYKLRHAAPLAVVPRLSLWNDKDDSGDYNPSASKKRIKSKDEQEKQKLRPQRPKRKAEEDQNETTGNEEKTRKKKVKGTTYAQGRRNGRDLILRFKLTSTKGRDLLVRLSDEYGAGTKHPREAHINIYTDGDPLSQPLPSDDGRQSTSAKDGGSFNSQPKPPQSFLLPFDTNETTQNPSSTVDTVPEVGELGLRNKKVRRDLVKNLSRKRKNKCQDCRNLKKQCQHKDQETKEEDENGTSFEQISAGAPSSRQEKDLENSPCSQKASSNNSVALRGTKGRCSLYSASTSDFHCPPTPVRSLHEKLSCSSDPWNIGRSTNINRGDGSTRPISISSSDSTDGNVNLSGSHGTFKNSISIRGTRTFSNTSEYAAPSHPPNVSVADPWVHRRPSNSSTNSTTLFNKSSLLSQTETRVITTNWAHPISFHYRPSVMGGSPSKPCHFCDDYRYGIYGCGLRDNVKVAICPATQRIQHEISGGHVELGKESTRMCVTCACKRLLIGRCPGNRHTMEKIETINVVRPGGTGSEMKRYIDVLLDRSHSRSRTPEFPTCHLCFAPATQQCCVRQEKSLLGRPLGDRVVKGCGLMLCQKCVGDLDEVSWVKEKMEARILGRHGGKAKLRADSEFLWKGSALHVAWWLRDGAA